MDNYTIYGSGDLRFGADVTDGFKFRYIPQLDSSAQKHKKWY